MYCQRCGIFNQDHQKSCCLCRSDLSRQPPVPDELISVDLTRIPLGGILEFRKNTPFLQTILLLPILLVNYLFKRITGRRMNSLIYNSRRLKYHPTGLESVGNLNKKSFNRVSSFLELQGFEPIIDIENKTVSHKNFHRLYGNRQEKCFAIVPLGLVTGNVLTVTFTAFFRNKRNNLCFSLSNGHLLPVKFPPNIIQHSLPGRSIDQAWQEFKIQAQSLRLERLSLDLAAYLKLINKIHRAVIELGLKQDLFSTDQPQNEAAHAHQPKVTTCYFHPFVPAVRKCSRCGQGLCETCFTSWEGSVFCEACRPTQTAVTSTAPSLPADYAGFGVRAASALIDVFIIILLSAGLCLLSEHVLDLAGLSHDFGTLAFLLTFLFFVGFTCYYLIFYSAGHGRTIGQKVFGLKVIDQDGGPADVKMNVIRFTYYLLSLIFILPWLGFLFILFRKNKLGLHDQLAGSCVVYRKSILKTVSAWLMVLAIFLGVPYASYKHFDFNPSLPLLFSPGILDQELYLETQWEYKFDPGEFLTPQSVDGNLFLLTTPISVKVIDAITGKTGWEVKSTAEKELWTDYFNPDTPYLLFESHKPGRTDIINLNPETGDRLWKQSLEIPNVSKILADEDIVLVVDSLSITALDRKTGQLLWDGKQKPDLDGSYLSINQGILVQSSRHDRFSVTYLDKFTGRELWKIRDDSPGTGYDLERGWHCSYQKDNKIVLSHLKDRRVKWISGPEAGVVMAHDTETTPEGNEMIGLIYTSQKALDAASGKVVFEYPPACFFVVQTREYLVLSSTPPNPGIEKKSGAIIILDKKHGTVMKTIPLDNISQTIFITENSTGIYLLFYNDSLEKENGYGDQTYFLLNINRSDLTFKILPLGKNLDFYTIAVFPEQDLLFLANGHKMGAYRLPGPSEDRAAGEAGKGRTPR